MRENFWHSNSSNFGSNTLQLFDFGQVNILFSAISLVKAYWQYCESFGRYTLNKQQGLTKCQLFNFWNCFQNCRDYSELVSIGHLCCGRMSLLIAIVFKHLYLTTLKLIKFRLSQTTTFNKIKVHATCISVWTSTQMFNFSQHKFCHRKN